MEVEGQEETEDTGEGGRINGMVGCHKEEWVAGSQYMSMGKLNARNQHCTPRSDCLMCSW